jgi:YegS/Rv2252/BmrU family lipid kinase
MAFPIRKPFTSDEMIETWLIIVNPNAGVKKGTRDWPAILKMLNEEQVSFEYRLTESKSHAIGLTMRMVEEGYRRFCVVGGDGTLNEVLNGLLGQEKVPVSGFTLAMIPVGTGNDWCRTLGIPFDYRLAIRLLNTGNTMITDVGKVSYYHHEEKCNRFFMNVAGMGYDALVAKKTNLSKEHGRGGPLVYFYFIFASLFQYKFMDAVIEVDGEVVHQGGIFSMNVGIGKYNGGGMMQVPYAVPDDGLIDLMLIRKAPKWIVIRYAHKLFDGSLVNLPMVLTARGTSIRIRSEGTIYLETDGESMGHTPFEFDVLPRCLRVVCGSVPGIKPIA